MAIKYNTRLGARHLNVKAAQLRDVALKPRLKGIRCTNCGGDSEFEFHQHNAYPGSGSVDWVFHSCCADFERKVKQKLGM